jgi:hypothetical protein
MASVHAVFVVLLLELNSTYLGILASTMRWVAQRSCAKVDNGFHSIFTATGERFRQMPSHRLIHATFNLIMRTPGQMEVTQLNPDQNILVEGTQGAGLSI